MLAQQGAAVDQRRQGVATRRMVEGRREPMSVRGRAQGERAGRLAPMLCHGVPLKPVGAGRGEAGAGGQEEVAWRDACRLRTCPA